MKLLFFYIYIYIYNNVFKRREETKRNNTWSNIRLGIGNMGIKDPVIANFKNLNI